MSETENISITGIGPFHSGAGTWTLFRTSKGAPGFYNPLSKCELDNICCQQGWYREIIASSLYWDGAFLIV